MMKEEQIDFPNSSQPNSSTLNSSVYSDNKQEKLIQPTDLSETAPFSLHDITGDVDQIQTSLDNIRELIFDNLPDGTTIEELFCDDSVLLSPLLTNNNQTTNILTDNTQETEENNHFDYLNTDKTRNLPSQCKQVMLHKSEIPPRIFQTDTNNQLFEQWINDTTGIDEQLPRRNQLEHEKINLQGKLQRLEQQQMHWGK